MSRSKRALMLALCLCLCMPLASASAQSPSLISDEMIQTETVNYAKTVLVEESVLERSYNAAASEYYPYTCSLSLETSNASFLEYKVARRQTVQAGDVLMVFTVDIDEAALASTQLSLDRAREDYQAGKETRTAEIDALLLQKANTQDAFERAMLDLRIERAQVSYEQYCYQQECRIADIEEQLTKMQEQNSRTELIAPFDGVVSDLAYKRLGERVYANETLVTLYREDGMLLRISNDNQFFRYGMEVSVKSGGKNNQTIYRGRIVAADNQLPESRRLGHAFIELEPFENGEKPRLANLTATGVSQYLENVMLIPRRAAAMDGGKYYVECLVNGVPQKRFINVGLSTTSHSWVLQGLEMGDTVILN